MIRTRAASVPRLLAAILVCLTILAAVSGCGVHQEGVFLAEVVAVDDCELSTPFDLSLDFVAYDDCADMLYLRLQNGGKPISSSDGVEIQLSSLQALAESVAQAPVEFQLPSDKARLTLFLNKSCPESYVPLEAANGSLVVEALDVEHGGALVMKADFDLIDLRTDGIVANGAHFETDSEFSSFPPHKLYSWCP